MQVLVIPISQRHSTWETLLLSALYAGVDLAVVNYHHFTSFVSFKNVVTEVALNHKYTTLHE